MNPKDKQYLLSAKELRRRVCDKQSDEQDKLFIFMILSHSSYLPCGDADRAAEIIASSQVVDVILARLFPESSFQKLPGHIFPA